MQVDGALLCIVFFRRRKLLFVRWGRWGGGGCWLCFANVKDVHSWDLFVPGPVQAGTLPPPPPASPGPKGNRPSLSEGGRGREGWLARWRTGMKWRSWARSREEDGFPRGLPRERGRSGGGSGGDGTGSTKELRGREGKRGREWGRETGKGEGKGAEGGRGLRRGRAGKGRGG